MPNKWVSVAFFSILLIIAGWFSLDALIKLYSYVVMTEKVPVTKLEWTAFEKNPDVYYPKAHYHFIVSGKEYEGETIIKDWPYRSAWALEQGIKSRQHDKSVWYSPDNPSKYSTLQKKFPLKESFYAAIIWIVYGYFLFIGYRMQKGF